jgi:hypothetical protein
MHKWCIELQAFCGGQAFMIYDAVMPATFFGLCRQSFKMFRKITGSGSERQYLSPASGKWWVGILCGAHGKGSLGVAGARKGQR